MDKLTQIKEGGIVIPRNSILLSLLLSAFTALNCWLGDRKGIQPLKESLFDNRFKGSPLYFRL